MNYNPTYPSALVSIDQEGEIGTALKQLMSENGMTAVKLIGEYLPTTLKLISSDSRI